MTTPIEHKFCPSCKENLPLIDFQIDRRLSTGLKSYCRECSSAKTRDWQKRNPDKRRAAKLAELAREKEKRRIANEAKPPKEPLEPWYKRNLDKFKASQKKHRAKYAERYKVANSLYAKKKREELRKSDPQLLLSRERSNTCKKRGVTSDWYKAKLEEQEHKCAICGRGNNYSRPSFAIDHNHNCCDARSGCVICVRGLLCSICNTTLHKLEESGDWLNKAKAYLDRYAES